MAIDRFLPDIVNCHSVNCQLFIMDTTLFQAKHLHKIIFRTLHTIVL
jgi:hypothetical protein